MNPTLPPTAAAPRVDRNPPAKPKRSAPELPVNYTMVAELTVGYSMVIVMLAYLIFSSGVIGQII